jgi:hypothetical protein
MTFVENMMETTHQGHKMSVYVSPLLLSEAALNFATKMKGGMTKMNLLNKEIVVNVPTS